MHTKERAHTRREVVALGIGALVVAMVPLRTHTRRRVIRRALPTMGTMAEFVVVTDHEARAHEGIDAAMAELRHVERRMSRFRRDSDVGQLNAHASGRGVAVFPDTAMVLGAALRWAKDSGGAFDPAIGALTALWDVTRRTEPPPEDAVRRRAGRALYRAIELDDSQSAPVVAFTSADVQVDLGGIAKGYGVDRAVEALRVHGVTNGIVNVGGDLYALGRDVDGTPWRVGVRSPSDPSELVTTLDVEDEAVATSGDYEQYFRYRGIKYHHLIDPQTGAPRETRVHSTTVRAACCMDADAGATAAFVMSGDRALPLLARRGASLVVLE